MPTITLKNIPADLHRALKKRAQAHHRSLNREVIATLQSAANNVEPINVAQLIESARAIRKKVRRPVKPAEIDAWKRAGRL